MMDTKGDITRSLQDHAASPPSALDSVMPLVYDELRSMARRTIGPGGRSPTLQPTALVNEAYLRLSRERNGWGTREAFMLAAAVAMRRALIDYARARSAKKRSPGGVRRPPECIAIHGSPDELLALEDCLKTLEREDADAGRVVELVVYGGLTLVETAEILGVSERTVQRRWRFARAWLSTKIFGDAA